MGRTIHDTWGVAQRAEQDDWSDPAIPKAIAAEMRQNWMRQRAIRGEERRVRRQGELAPPPVDPEMVPIFIDDDAPYVHHPASEEDIREVLRRLPPGSLDGLREVRLCVDRRAATSEARVRDPFLGGLRLELYPGIFDTGRTGTYRPSTARIRIFASLCRPGAVGPLALHLKVAALKTLVHEAAHHFDFTFRMRRSRWGTMEKEKHEAWARRIEREQARAIVAPYILARYPAELEELGRWVEAHGGVVMEPRVLLFVAARPVESLARSVMRGDDPETARLELARVLHEIGANGEAQAIVDARLATPPDDARALAISACIRQCERRDLDEATALCRRALAADPGCIEAWDVLVRGCAIQQRWDEAARACEDAIARTPAGQAPRWYFLRTLAEAHLRLRAWDAVASDVARMREGDRADLALCDAFLVLASCWSKQWELALGQASRLLAAGRHGEHREWLLAAKFESAHHLGRPAEAGPFDERALRALEANVFTEAWGRRIRAHVGPSPG